MAKSIIYWKRLLWVGLAFLTLFCTQLVAQSSPAPKQLLERGIEFYQGQRYQEAVAVWEQAILGYQETDSPLDQALSFHYLSLGYQQQGNWKKAEETINQSLEILQETSVSPLQTEILAKALNTQGRLQYQQGKPKLAYQTWEQSAQFYDQVGNKKGKLIAQLNQTQALQAQGFILKAKQHLESLRVMFPEDATTLRYLGIALRNVGNLSVALATLEKSLNYEQTPETWLAIANTELELGKQSWTQNQFEDATNYFHSAQEHYQNSQSLLPAQLNQLRLQIEIGQWEQAIKQLPRIQKNIANFPISRQTVRGYYNLAESLICLRPDYQVKASSCDQFSQESPSRLSHPPTWKTIAEITSKGLKQARQLKDIKGESEGLGLLGNLYEHTQQWEEAQQLTQRASTLINPISASELTYRWEWQLGRIETQLGNLEDATAYYHSALVSLEKVRESLVSINTNVRFSFQQKVEPLYREYVELLVREEPTQAELKSAIAAVNNLQLAELENYLRCSLRPRLNLTQNLAEIDPKAAYLYPILLSNELIVITQLPEQPLKLYRHALAEETVQSTLEQLQTGILRRRSDLTRNSGKQFYNWLIAPLEAELAKNSNLKTLVFTLDPKLRNLPLAVLYDERNQEYLIDKPSAIALTPNSQLFTLENNRNPRLNVLGGGISESLQIGQQQFSSLKAQEELSQLQNLTNSSILLNQAFTSTQLESAFQRQPFSIIHLATHAQFSSNPEQTYILAYDDNGEGKLLNSAQFSGLLQQLQQQSTNEPLELLVLSACETATGDDRALLGLAGVAIQSGAESTLATQWQVSDDSTVALMREFYQQLAQPNISKAQALQKAQQSLKNNPNTQNPFFWGAYILVGNWL